MDASLRLRSVQHDKTKNLIPNAVRNPVCGCFTSFSMSAQVITSQHTHPLHTFFSVHSLKFNYQHNLGLSMLCSSAWKYTLLIWLRLASKTF